MHSGERFLFVVLTVLKAEVAVVTVIFIVCYGSGAVRLSLGASNRTAAIALFVKHWTEKVLLM